MRLLSALAVLFSMIPAFAFTYPTPVNAPATPVDYYKGFWSQDSQNLDSISTDPTGAELTGLGVNIVAENITLCWKPSTSTIVFTPGEKARIKQRIRQHHTNQLHVLLVNNLVMETYSGGCASGNVQSGVTIAVAENLTFHEELIAKVTDVSVLANDEHVTLYSMVNEPDHKLGNDPVLASNLMQQMRGIIRATAFGSKKLLYEIGMVVHIANTVFTDFNVAGISITPMGIAPSTGTEAYNCFNRLYSPEANTTYTTNMGVAIQTLLDKVPATTKVIVSNLGVWGNGACSSWSTTKVTDAFNLGFTKIDEFNVSDPTQMAGVFVWEGREEATYNATYNSEVFVSEEWSIQAEMDNFFNVVFPH